MIVGIDLGTSTSEISYVDENGEINVVANRDGEPITPSVVHIKHNGRAVVGSRAREYLFTRPDCTFMEVKRIFGTDEKLMAHGKIYAPEEIQAHIIEYLIDCAEEYVGEDVSAAVITVPAYFTDVQRKQTIRAGALAGIQVARVINEPTAAALYHGLQNLTECEHILVYDFGGGTLDVTVLELFEGVIEVKSSCGNSRLGGKDFDTELMKHIAGTHHETLMADAKAAMKLKQAAIACKVALSDDDAADVRLPLIAEDVSIDKTVTRNEFEGLIHSMLVSTGEQIDRALRDAGLSVSDLQKVILVGGTTRIPAVRRFVEEKLGINVEYDDERQSPELMVVRGAGLQAAIIEGRVAEEQSVVLTDVCPFSLGVKTVTSEGFRVVPMIPRNVTIPYEYSHIYSALHEYQRAILFEIYQGESIYPRENTRIGQLHLDKLPRRKDERARAEVTFSYDANGLLNVTARSLGNDSSAATIIDINNNDLPTHLPVRLRDWEKAEGAAKYRPLLRKVQKVLDEYAGTSIFVEEHLYIVSEQCDDLKAGLILGDEEGIPENAERLRYFLENWE